MYFQIYSLLIVIYFTYLQFYMRTTYVLYYEIKQAICLILFKKFEEN